MPTTLAPSLQPLLRLDRESPVPLYAQVEENLRKLITRPEYAVGELLPDEVMLSGAMGISRNTLRAAIGRLVDEGRLQRKAGVGTRVVKPRVSSGMGAWHSFTQEMAGKGIKVENYEHDLRLVRASAEVAQRLQIAPGTKVIRLERVRGWEKKPTASFVSYFHPRLNLSAQDDFTKPLYELIRERSGVMADESEEEFKAVAADQRLARLLKVKAGSPLLCRNRTVLDQARRPIEWATVHYRCDRFELTINLRNP